MFSIYLAACVFVIAVLLDEIGSVLITALVQLTIDEKYRHRPALLKNAKKCLLEVKEAFILLGGLALLVVVSIVEGVKDGSG